jgi:hypothetical protein
MHQKIDFSAGWRIFYKDLDMGLFGNSGRAYQHDFEPEECVTTDVPVTAPGGLARGGQD